MHGYAAVTSSLGYRHLLVARAREIAGGPQSLESIATCLSEYEWGPRPSVEWFTQDDDHYLVAYLREDPEGIPEGEWLWLHDELKQLGWGNQLAEVLRGSTGPLQQPEVIVSHGALEALLDDYDSGGAWLREGLNPTSPPAATRVGVREAMSRDWWFERGVGLLGPPPIGRVWYASTITRLLDEHRPGWFDQLIDDGSRGGSVGPKPPGVDATP